jgi:hypothetical protein
LKEYLNTVIIPEKRSQFPLKQNREFYMNEILWFLSIALNFSLILAAYRFFGKTGLFIWMPVSIILANIEVLKAVELFGISATLGNVIYATSFLATDIISENYGKKEAAKAVYAGFFALLVMTVLIQLALLFKPSQADFAQEHLVSLFSMLPRLALASTAAYLVSQYHDVWAYHFWKNKFPGSKFLWLRNNLSTMVSQLIDTLIFTFGAFWGVFESSVLFEILLSTYFLKWIAAALDTPFLYFAVRMHNKRKL